MSDRDLPILIAGGGIGGLAAAIALAREGVAARVLEKSPSPTEAGAGIQLGPNGCRALKALGVFERLEPLAGKPRSLAMFDGPSGRVIARLPLGDDIERRHGAGYRTYHRGDLHAALVARAREPRLIELTWSFEFADIARDAEGVTVTSVSGDTARGAALVGADGLWSRVRGVVTPSRLRPSRYVALRALVDASVAGPLFTSGSVGLWLGRAAHVVHYPVRSGRVIAVVAVLQGGNAPAGWDHGASGEDIARGLATFAPELARFADNAPSWGKWALFDPKPLDRWSLGGVTLLGDAAHPILPFLAQGGALALEDALELAARVARERDNPSAAFAAYERVRKPRAARVQAASRRNGWIYHLGGPMAAARNIYLSGRSPEQLMAAYDWLYGWRPRALST